MPHQTKIATCSYCGSRTVLRLVGRVRHELACSACGARLHTMKPLKISRPAEPPRKPPRPARHKPRRKPERKSGFFDLLEEIWDEVEDIFD